MKRLVTYFLLLITVLLLSSCGNDSLETGKNMQLPVQFFYCDSASGESEYYEQSTGAIRWEYRDLGNSWPSASDMLAKYMQGPVSGSLHTPFPPGVMVTGTSLKDGVFSIQFNDAFSKLSGEDLMLAAACVVHTMTQHPGVESVQLDSADAMLSALTSSPLEPDDFLRIDDQMQSDHTAVRLYFPKRDGRYLRVESRTGEFKSSDSIPLFTIQRLMEGSVSSFAEPAVPYGTELRSIEVTDGFCTIDFSSSFLTNAPDSCSLARLQLLSVVNTITDLEGIKFVRLLCEGEPVTSFGPLELPVYLKREEAAVEAVDPAVVRDITLYLPSGQQELLAAVPINVRKTSGKGIEAEVLNALIEFESQNGYRNPIPDGTTIVDIACAYRVCRVTFSNSFAACDRDPISARRAIRSIVATLCALDTVDHVEIAIADGDLRSIDLSKGFVDDESWLMP